MKRVISADFGAGNTCFFSIVPEAEHPAPTPLVDANASPSGYFITKDNKWHVGHEMINLSWEAQRNLKMMHINIKAIPNKDNEAELVSYFKAWLETLKMHHRNEFDNSDELYWMIGCPTGDEWKSNEIRDKYRNIFVKAGYGKPENIMIIPESNAAIAFYQYEQGALDYLDKGAGLLLIDQGAYSLDATYYHDGNITSIGSYLGASIVEKMMLQVILYTSEEKYRMNRREHNLPDTLSYIRKLYETPGEKGEVFRTFLLLKARKLKEDYFTQLRSGSLSISRDLVNEVELEDNMEPLVLYTNRHMMQDIMEEFSVKSVLGSNFDLLHKEVREELQNKSWMQAFNSYLKKLDKEFPDYYNAASHNSSRAQKPVVLMTGGGSMMDCIVEAVTHHYPNATVGKDPKAISAIGTGMAYWAPDKINALKFDQVFSDYINKNIIDEDGEEVPIFVKYFADAFDACLQNITPDLIEEESNAVIHGITEWKNYKCSSNGISVNIRAHFNNWIKNTGIPKMSQKIDEQVALLKQRVNKDFSDIMEVYGFEKEILLRDDDSVFLSESKGFLSDVFKVIGEIIIKHYDEFNFSEYFPDYNEGIFSDKRNNHYNQLIDSLNQWISNETDSTVKLIVNAFITEERLTAGDEKYTYRQYFILEGLIDISNLIDERKKQLLGKLVLEEFINA